MSKHFKPESKTLATSFRAASLRVDPSLLAIACYLARIAAEEDYKVFCETGAVPHTDPDEKGGPK